MQRRHYLHGLEQMWPDQDVTLASSLKVTTS